MVIRLFDSNIMIIFTIIVNIDLVIPPQGDSHKEISGPYFTPK